MTTRSGLVTSPDVIVVVRSKLRLGSILKLRFYWSLGRDIVNLKAEARWGNKFLKTLSADLRKANPDTSSFSETNLKYMKYFYEMYQPAIEICPQVEDKSSTAISPQVGD